MSELTDFLEARLAEDADVARAIVNGDPRWLRLDEGPPWHCDEQSDHVAMPPARVLVEVEAKRAIVALHDSSHECSCYDHAGDIQNCTWVDDPDDCSTLRLLASVHRDHPGYQEGWAL